MRNFLILSRQSEEEREIPIFIHEAVMKYSRRKEMELKCFLFVLRFASVGTFLIFFLSATECFDVNSCHAFLIRLVIRCDCEMMIAPQVGRDFTFLLKC